MILLSTCIFLDPERVRWALKQPLNLAYAAHSPRVRLPTTPAVVGRLTQGARFASPGAGVLLHPCHFGGKEYLRNVLGHVSTPPPIASIMSKAAIAPSDGNGTPRGRAGSRAGSGNGVKSRGKSVSKPVIVAAAAKTTTSARRAPRSSAKSLVVDTVVAAAVNGASTTAAAPVSTPTISPRTLATAAAAAAAGDAAAEASGAPHAMEFGGPFGALSIMVFSHALLYYVYYCLAHNAGSLFLPGSWDDLRAAGATIVQHCAPTWTAAGLYFGYLGLEVVLALVSPGLLLTGRPDETGRRLQYQCNACIAWWITLSIIVVAHVTNVFHMSAFIQNYGACVGCVCPG